MFDGTRDRAIDWTKVARWTEQLVAGQVSEVCAELANRMRVAPTFIWNPQPDDLQSTKLRFLLEYWTSLRDGDRLPLTRAIDPIRMRPALGYVMLIDVIDGGRDFRYRLYGTMLAAVSGFDMTGRLLSNHGASVDVIEFSLATCRAVVIRREPVFTARTPTGALYTSRWHRIAMPLVDEAGTVVRLLVGTVPLSHAGEIVSARL